MFDVMSCYHSVVTRFIFYLLADPGRGRLGGLDARPQMGLRGKDTCVS